MFNIFQWIKSGCGFNILAYRGKNSWRTFGNLIASGINLKEKLLLIYVIIESNRN